jgi:hypothetical protein
LNAAEAWIGTHAARPRDICVWRARALAEPPPVVPAVLGRGMIPVTTTLGNPPVRTGERNDFVIE